MSYTCPVCKSDQVQSFRMAYETGTATSTSRTTGGGFAAVDGTLVPAFGGGTTRTTSMSLVAQKVSPPRVRTVPWWAWLLGVLFFPLGLIIPLVLHFNYKKWNEGEYPKLRLAWERSWICLKCGHIFQST